MLTATFLSDGEVMVDFPAPMGTVISLGLDATERVMEETGLITRFVSIRC